MERAIKDIVTALGHISDLLQGSAEDEVSSNGPKFGSDFDSLEVVRTPTFHREPDAKPGAHRDIPEDLETVEKAIAAHNERMRRKNKPAGSEIEDARRRKLGLAPEEFV